jgi:hypothetical protein
MTTITPSSLPPVDVVEIADLAGVGIRINDVSHMAAATDARCVQLQGASADRIAELWRNLQPGEQMRCHIPPFGLRFYSSDKLIYEASICWRCNNVHGQANGEKIFFEFDGSAPGARQLLAACEQVLGRPVSDE